MVHCVKCLLEVNENSKHHMPTTPGCPHFLHHVQDCHRGSDQNGTHTVPGDHSMELHQPRLQDLLKQLRQDRQNGDWFIVRTPWDPPLKTGTTFADGQHPRIIRKKARKAMPFFWLFSFRGENRVSIFAWGIFRHLGPLGYHNEAIHGTNANLDPSH